MVLNLPPESALASKYRGGVPWSQETELLAVQAELIFALIRVAMQGFGAKPRQIPKPLEIPRPYQAPKTKRVIKGEAAIAALEGLLRGPNG